jgi:hypothetical protein
MVSAGFGFLTRPLAERREKTLKLYNWPRYSPNSWMLA